MQKDGLVLGRLAGGPSHAVFTMELGGQRPSGQPDVLAVLSPPDGELVVAIEAEPEANMAEDVMDSAKPVIETTGLRSEQGMTGEAGGGRHRYLQNPLVPDGTDQLPVCGVGLSQAGEDDADAPGSVGLRDPGEKDAGLHLELGVGGHHTAVTGIHGRGRIGVGHLVGDLEVEAGSE